jgi:phage/plasmid-like protein (TIGR03299 family)
MAANPFGRGFAGAFGKSVKDSPFAPQNQFEDGVSIDEVAERSGLNFEFGTCPSLYMVNGSLKATGEKTIFRKDNGDFISTMSAGYAGKLVQPMEILKTHEQFLDAGGYHLRAAGTFKNGARFWSMAEAHGELVLPGEDRLKSYLFMASAADGSSATYAIGTAMRATCWNMSPAIIDDAKANGKFIRVTHSQVFNADEARVQIQANDANFLLWANDARQLADEKVSVNRALEYFADVFDVESDEGELAVRLDAVQENKRAQKCLELFCGAGMGSDLASAKETAWGAYNAITEYCDHHANTDSSESRLMSNTMGAGLRLKTRAWNLAKALI